MSSLEGTREIEISLSAQPETRAVVTFGKAGAGFPPIEVLHFDLTTAPTAGVLKSIHAERLSGRTTPVIVAATYGLRSWLLGTTTAKPPVEVPVSVSERVLQSALAAQDSIQAANEFNSFVDSFGFAEMAGVRNIGLFASHHVKENVPNRLDWPQFTKQGIELARLRNLELVRGLGFEVASESDNTLVLCAPDQSNRAVAVLLDDSEQFESPSGRFPSSPVSVGLSVAEKVRAPWLIVMRRSQIRLYPGRDGVGVGQKGQSETFLELNLSQIGEEYVGLLPMIFLATSLQEDGLTEQLLRDSSRFAAELGARLRERIYDKVVPSLAVEIASQLPKLNISMDSKGLMLAYSITLRILFRLLFQAYAEDRGLLPSGRNEYFDANSLKTIAKRDIEVEDSDFGSASSIWADLIQVWDSIDEGNARWQIPAYNGGLFGRDPVRHPEGSIITGLRVPDSVLGPALQALLIDATQDGVRGPVDFRSLSVREFGTIYEGLLESSLSVAKYDLKLDQANAWVPATEGDPVAVAAGEVYFHSASGERKATGAYFTPAVVVEKLIATAIDGPLDRHLELVSKAMEQGDSAKASAIFFDFRVADLAMGSGHFLVAAVDRIEAKMRSFLAEQKNQVPGVISELGRLKTSASNALGADSYAVQEIEDASLLRRQVARRCVYGIDINPLAVELSRLALWIHTFVPGLPMSSLDHNLVCANSLTGVSSIDEALDAIIPNRVGAPTLFDEDILAGLSKAKVLLSDAANASEATKAEVAEAEKISKAAAEAALDSRHIFNAAVAARLGVVSKSDLFNEAQFAELGRSVEVLELVEKLKPAHFPLLFPEVFLRENPGFDVLFGNPPWEELTVEEPKFWTRVYPGLIGMADSARRATISELRSTYPDLLQQFEKDSESVAFQRKALLAKGYPGLGTGDVDLYLAFAWTNWRLVRNGGKVSMVFPRSLLSAAGAEVWRKEVFEHSGASISVLVNTGGWIFPAVTPQYTVALVNVEKAKGNGVLRLSGPFGSKTAFTADQWAEAELSFEELIAISESAGLPVLPTKRSVEIIQKLSRFPKLIDSVDGVAFRPVSEFHATNDKTSFTSIEGGSENKLPVIGGRGINLWKLNLDDTFAIADENIATRALFERRLNQVTRANSVFFGMQPEIVSDIRTLPVYRPRIVFRDIARATDLRTFIAALVPPRVLLTNKAPYLFSMSHSPKHEAFLLGVICSLPTDWYTKRFAELGMNFHIVNKTPVPWAGIETIAGKQLVQNTARLAAIDERFMDWATSLGVEVGSVTTPEDFEQLVSENDALVAHLYGLSKEELVDVLSAFERLPDFDNRSKRVIEMFEKWGKQ